IPAGTTDRYRIAVCVLRAGESPESVLGDVFANFAARFPATLHWQDRRPIGLLILAGHGKTTQANPGNPRYWRFLGPSTDVNSPAGRTEFETKLLQEADNAVAISKKMNAQGVIVWDIDGQEPPFPVSYVGDPRRLAPEIEGVADKFFKRITDAGLRCGVNAGARKFGVEGGQAYQEWLDDPEALFQLLNDKIEFVQRRWGCTLFYIDAPGNPMWPAAAEVFRKLNAKHPDILLSPEQRTTVDYAWTAPYWDVRNGPSPSREARWIYPH